MNDLRETARNIFSHLYDLGVPGLIVGGYAMSNYGYLRYTNDVDVVTVRTGELISLLNRLKDLGYQEGEEWFKLIDPRTGVGVDILPASAIMNNILPTPTPTRVSDSPVFCSLEALIALKCGVVVKSKDSKAVSKNESDIGYLISINSPSRDFLDETFTSYPEILVVYRRLWDQEQKAKSSSLVEDPFQDFFFQ